MRRIPLLPGRSWHRRQAMTEDCARRRVQASNRRSRLLASRRNAGGDLQIIALFQAYSGASDIASPLPPRLRRAPEGLPPRTPLRGAGPCRGGPRPAFSARFTFRKLSTMVPARRPSDHKRAVKAAHPAGLRSQRRRRCGARPGLDCPFSGNLPGGP